MLTLYHAPQSRSSRIIWLLEELGAEYEIKYVDIPRQDGSGGPDKANPNPDKKVPALVHDGVVITESIAIVLYLTDLFPEAGMGPKIGDPKRGLYLTWLAYYAGVIEPLIVANFAGFADHFAVKLTWRDQATMHKRLLDSLNQSPYLLGENFSGADLIIASIGQWMRAALPEGRLMDDYLQRCYARPAAKQAFQKDAKASE
jgi:glutathione S-transferase